MDTFSVKQLQAMSASFTRMVHAFEASSTLSDEVGPLLLNFFRSPLLRTDGQFETAMHGLMRDKSCQAVEPAYQAYTNLLLPFTPPVQRITVVNETDDALNTICTRVVDPVIVNNANDWASQTQDSLLTQQLQGLHLATLLRQSFARTEILARKVNVLFKTNCVLCVFVSSSQHVLFACFRFV